MASFAYIDSEKWSKLNRLKTMIQRYFKEPLLQLTGELGRPTYSGRQKTVSSTPDAGYAKG